jgi:hypothetical protein
MSDQNLVEDLVQCGYKNRYKQQCQEFIFSKYFFCEKHFDKSKKTIIQKNSNKTIVQYTNENNKLHRKNGPAYIEKSKNVNIKKYFVNGKPLSHYLYPYQTEEYKNFKVGNITIPLRKTSLFEHKTTYENFDKCGELHSFDETLPSYEKICKIESIQMWHQHGTVFRLGRLKPAVITNSNYINPKNKSIMYEQKLEFSTNPSLVVKFKEVEETIEYSWKRNGVHHRDDDKPSRIVICNKSNSYIQHYLKHGMSHRISGPAIYNLITKESKWYFYGHRIQNEFLTDKIKMLLQQHNSNSKFVCKCCFNVFGETSLPLECGHWIHPSCYRTNKIKDNCLDCNQAISQEHSNFLNHVIQFFDFDLNEIV